jgi:2-polyprenyl-3-methyl-5-hydroxy-6-metoxy-1,4-benzoquinol methylase
MIHETGYWLKENSISQHIHSQNLSDWIINFLVDYKDHQIYDFGCGLGNYLNDLYNNGFKNIMGIEADPMKTDYAFEIMKLNLSEQFQLEKKGIVICLEVGEHIPKKYQENLLNNLKNNCDKYLILSWAVRNQQGYGHFNELNNDEILPLIEDLGFKYLDKLSQDARLVPEEKCAYFRNTIMIFEKI